MKNINNCLIVGASGLLGASFAKKFVMDKVQVAGIVFNHSAPAEVFSQKSLDLSVVSDSNNPDLDGYDLIIYCSAITSIEACEDNEKFAEAVHVKNAASFARNAVKAGAKFVYISTDQLWNGTSSMMAEDDIPKPVNAYGRTKFAGELAVLDACDTALILRTNFLSRGEKWQKSFADWVVTSLQKYERVTGYDNIMHTPLHTDLLYSGMISLLNTQARGIFHVAGGEKVSKYEVICAIAERFGLDSTLITKGDFKPSDTSVLRPLDMSLSCLKVEKACGWKAPSLRESLSLL